MKRVMQWDNLGSKLNHIYTNLFVEFNLGGFQNTGRGKADLSLLLIMYSRLSADEKDIMLAIVDDISTVSIDDFKRIRILMLSILNVSVIHPSNRIVKVVSSCLIIGITLAPCCRLLVIAYNIQLLTSQCLKQCIHPIIINNCFVIKETIFRYLILGKSWQEFLQ